MFFVLRVIIGCVPKKISIMGLSLARMFIIEFPSGDFFVSKVLLNLLIMPPLKLNKIV